VRITKHEWIEDSAGPGRWRGGLGNRKEYQLLGEATVTVRLGHQFDFSGWGVFGGLAPRAMQVFRNAGTEREEALHPLQTLTFAPGETFMVEMAGGGGYGDPRERTPGLVLTDVLSGYVSAEAAARDYGVAVDREHRRVDDEATAALRSGPPSAAA
jgi:N-methylhydantoinase B